MVYVNDIIKDSLALIDAIQFGEEPEAEFSDLAVRTLNGMLGEWASRGIYNPTQVIAQISSTSATAKNYITMGTGNIISSGTIVSATVGDIPFNFATIKDVQIDLGTTTYNLKQITMTEYMSMSVKQTQTIPQFYAWDFQSPISKIYFYPSLQSGLTIRVIGSPKFDNIPSSQQYMGIDDMYYSALVFNLACSLYSFLKRDIGIDKELIYKAKSAIEGLRSRTMAMNAKSLRCPYSGTTHSDNDYWTSTFNTVTK